MKKIVLLLAAAVLLTPVLSAQVRKAGEKPANPLTQKINEVKQKNHSAGKALPGSLTLCRSPQTASPEWKAVATFKQKLDSMSVQYYDWENQVLAVNQNSQFAYDSAGRPVLYIQYVNNAWEQDFHWYKDTAAFNADGEWTLEASFHKKETADPWILQYRMQRFFDSAGRQNLILEEYADWLTGLMITQKHDIYYDDAGNPTLTIHQQKDSISGEWVNFAKVEVQFDENGNELSYAHFTWSEELHDWIQQTQMEWAYDEAGRVISMVDFSWDPESGSWIGWGREEISYDPAGNMTLYMIYYWDSENKAWVPGEKQVSAYDQHGNRTEDWYAYYDRETATWQPVERATWVYDANQNVIELNRFGWIAETSAWKQIRKDSRTYNESNLLIETVYYFLDEEQDILVASRKRVYEYNDNGQPGLSSYFRWLVEENRWEEYSRIEIAYDNLGNMTGSLDLSGKDSTGEWSSKSRMELTYNQAYLVGEVLSPYGELIEYQVSMLMSETENVWDPEKKEWLHIYQSDYFYSEFQGNSGVDMTGPENPRLFPNPATREVWIETGVSLRPARLELTDLNGRIVRLETLPGALNRVSVSDLPAGLYLYRMTVDGRVTNGKLIVR